MNEDPLFHVQGKHLESQVYDRTLDAFVTVTDTQIPHGSQDASIDFGRSVEIKNERNVSKSREVKTVVAVDAAGVPQFINRGGTYFFGASELERFATLLVKKNQTVSSSTSPNSEYNSITSAMDLMDPAHGRVTDLRANSFTSLWEFSLDDEGNLWRTENKVVEFSDGNYIGSSTELRDVDSRRAISSTKEFVSSMGASLSGQHNEDVCLPERTEDSIEDAAPGMPEPGEEISFKEMKKDGKFRVRKTTLVGWASYERSWAETVEMRYPSVFEGFTGGDFVTNFLNQHRRTDFVIHYSRLRTSKSVVCKLIQVETLKKEDQVQAVNFGACFSFKPADWNYNGTLFNVQLTDVICDPTTIVASTNSDDTYYGYGAETVTLPASVPSFSNLQAYIANETELLISVKVQPWRFCLFKVTKSYIVLAPF